MMKINIQNKKNIQLLISTLIIIGISVFLIIKQVGKADITDGGMTINGIVTNLDEEPVEDALVLFMRGDTIINQTFSDATGKYQITLREGYYNMQVVTDDGLTDIESPLQVAKDDYYTTLEYNIGTIPDDNFEISQDIGETSK